jgi:hypothetical protein
VRRDARVPLPNPPYNAPLVWMHQNRWLIERLWGQWLEALRADVEELRAKVRGADSVVTLTATGFTTALAAPARFIRQGALVTVLVPEIHGTSNAPTFTLEGIPPGFLPSVTTWALARVQDDSGNGQWGMALFSAASGVIDLYPSADDTVGFTPSGTKGIYAQVLRYLSAEG